MKKCLLVFTLFLCGCKSTPHAPKYEVTLLDGTKLITSGYCEWYTDTNIIVRCKSEITESDGFLGGTIDWESVYVAKEIHKIGE